MIVNEEIVRAAENLEILLVKYSKKSRPAEVVLNDLKPFLASVKNGSLKLPVSRVPRSYDFHEGELRQFSDLENAYSVFATQVKGYDLEGARKFVEEIDRDIKNK